MIKNIKKYFSLLMLVLKKNVLNQYGYSIKLLIILFFALNISSINAQQTDNLIEVNTIKEAFEKSIEFNQQLVISNNKVLAKFENYNVIYKDILPQISLFVSAKPWSISVKDGITTDGRNSLSEKITIKQPLFSWFTTVSDFIVAEYQVELELAKFDDEQQKILQHVAITYNSVISNRTNLKLQNRRLLQSKNRVEFARTSYKIGSLSQTSLALTEAELSRATVQAIQTKRSLEESEYIFKDITNSKISSNAKLPDFRKLIPILSEEEFINKAIKQNHILKTLENANKIANYRYKQSLSTPLPIKIDLLLTGAWGQEWGNNISGLQHLEQKYSVEIQGFLQLYQGGYSGSIRRKLHATSDKFKSEYSAAKQSVIRSAKLIYRRLKDHSLLFSASIGAVNAQQTAKEGFIAGEKLGLYSRIDVIEAEKQFLATKLEQVNTQLNIINTEIEALSLLGLFNPSIFKIKTNIESPRNKFKKSKWNISYFE